MMGDKSKTKVSRRTVLKGVVAAAAAPSVFNINHAWSKDVVWDGKPFNAGGKFFGYGNPAYVNAGCLAEVPTGGTALTCTGNVKSVDQITAGFWDKIYSGSFGYVRIGLQYSHTDLDTFAARRTPSPQGLVAP